MNKKQLYPTYNTQRNKKYWIIRLNIADKIVWIYLNNIKLYRQVSQYYKYTLHDNAPDYSLYIIEVNQLQNKGIRIINSKTVIITMNSVYILDNVLFAIRLLIQLLLVRDTVILLHASSFQSDGKAFLFCGPSGIGKSTILKNVPQKNILSDDMAIIRKVRSTYFAYSSIFDQKNKIIIQTKKFPIQNIYVLHQSKIVKVVSLNQNRAFADIFSSTLIYHRMDIVAIDLQRKSLFSKKHSFKNADITINKQLKKFCTLLIDLQSDIHIKALYISKNDTILKLLNNLN